MPAPSLFNYTTADQTYPIVSIPTCRVCRSEQYRKRVEYLLVEGLSPAGVAKALPEDSGLSRRNVYEHVRRGHLPVHHEVGRRLLSEKALSNGVEIAKQADTIQASLALAQLVLDRAIKELVVGNAKVTLRDGLRAAKLLGEWSVDRHEADRYYELAKQNAEAAVQLAVIARRHMQSEAWSEFVREADVAGLLAYLPAPSGSIPRSLSVVIGRLS